METTCHWELTVDVTIEEPGIDFPPFYPWLRTLRFSLRRCFEDDSYNPPDFNDESFDDPAVTEESFAALEIAT